MHKLIRIIIIKKKLKNTMFSVKIPSFLYSIMEALSLYKEQALRPWRGVNVTRTRNPRAWLSQILTLQRWSLAGGRGR